MRFILCTASMRHCTEGNFDFALKLSFYPVTSSREAREDLAKSLSGCVLPVTATSFTSGCWQSKRASSAPMYPVTFMIPALIFGIVCFPHYATFRAIERYLGLPRN